MKNNLLKILLLFILSGICVYSIYRMNEIKFIQDDAYITLRYVQNFINGNGLVFNLGERVEGYTNFLWVMILSLFGVIAKIFSLQIDLALVSQILSQLSGIALLILSFYFTKKILITKYLMKNNDDYLITSLLSLIPPLLISFSSPFLYWGVSGMESTLFTFLTLLSIYRYMFRNYDKPDAIFIAASILNSLLRPEGFLIFLLIVIHSKIYSSKFFNTIDKSDTTLISIHTKEIIYYIILLIAFLLFRFLYYGYLLPNTFYAKTGFNLEHFKRGVDYVLSAISNNFFYGILLIIPLINFRKSVLRSATVFFYFFVLTYLIFIVLIGGDVLPVDRFILPILPLVLIFSLITIYRLRDLSISPFKKPLLLLSVAIILSFLLINSYRANYDNMRTKRSYEVGLVNKMKVYADWVKKKQLEKTGSQKINVTLSTIGAFSFFSEARVIDLVGLTDEYIAHNPKEVPGIDEELPVLWKERRYNAEYVLKQNPDYIIFPAGAKPTAFAECAIFVQPEFYKNYYAQLIYSEELKQLLPIFTKRENILRDYTGDCNVRFVKPYIEANNLFIEMNTNKKYELLSTILDKCDDAVRLCPSRKSEIDALRGYSFYHYGDKENAKLFFESSLDVDSLNMISRFYLMKIFNEVGDQMNMLHQFKQIKKYSPNAILNNYITN